MIVKKKNKSTNITNSNSITNHKKAKNSGSFGRVIKRQSTLFDILKKRNSDKAFSFSKGKKNLLINKTSVNNVTIEINNNINNLKNQYIYKNYRRNIAKRNIIKEKFLKTENNLSLYNLEQDKQNNKNESSNEGKYNNLKKEREIFNKKVIVNQKQKNEEKKRLIIKRVYNSKKLIDYYKSISSFEDENEKQKK